MAENKEYFSKEVENGSIQISEEVVASVAAMAVLEVEGVCGLASNLGYDIAEMLGKKTLAKGVRMSTEGDALRIDCEIVAQFGAAGVRAGTECAGAREKLRGIADGSQRGTGERQRVRHRAAARGQKVRGKDRSSYDKDECAGDRVPSGI